MQSFRGIGDLTLEFDETEPTVFIGINGVGKSSILDCLAILLSQFIGRIASEQDKFTPANQSRNISGSQINIFGDIFGKLNLYSDNSSQSRGFGVQTSKIRDFSEQDITNGYEETYNEIQVLLDSLPVNWFLKNTLKGNSKNLDNYDQELKTVIEEIHRQWQTNPETNLPLAVYYRVNRAVIDISLDISKDYSFEQTDAYEQALNGIQINFITFFQWFRTLEDLENEKRRDTSSYRSQQLEAARQAIYSLIPYFSNLRVRRSPLRMTVEKQGQEFIINQLSDGEKCLLAMVGDLARRLAIANPSLPDPLQGSGVVLIDEIELHLHPKWQREIIPALTRTFPNCQFIVTTHSPQVISQVKPEGIYILEKTDEGVVAKRPESSFGRDSNRILEDLMGVPARPQEIKDRLHELFRLIDEGNLDGARQLSQEIADIIGQDEPELVKASVSIRRKEILKR
ncbi:AAA family ATPase [Nostoc sp.]|uniref:AAA family ATPase n=1 Tax=Nostoc sp. TaxID=1180 RepID=UPI003FA5EE38